VSDHLRAAARRRHDEAERRATDALRRMSKDGSPVNFVAVARRAGVSTDFLYRHADLRERIEAMRAAGAPDRRPAAPPQAPVDDGGGASSSSSSSSGVVVALSRQLRELRKRHREEVARLERALAAAHGENLELRRRLAACEPDRPSKPHR
jgi:hypothetical protein